MSTTALALDDLLAQFGQHLIRWRNGEGDGVHAMADDVSLLLIERKGEE